MNTPPDHPIDSLRSVVGSRHVLTDESMKASYEIDWSRRWSGRSAAVVRPGDTAEVAQCVRLLASFEVPIVPQGGNTGLVGGSVPAEGDPVILSTQRLRAISKLDPMSGQIEVGAGVTLAELQQAVAATDWEPGVDLAARSSATVGGMVATNAGGVRVLRHGMMRDQVAGLEYVTATGDVVSALSGFVKNNTGYDLVNLLCGSEGTLGIITRVLVQLVPRQARRVTALVPVEGIGDAVARLVQIRRAAPTLDALEYVSAATLNLVCAHRGLTHPFSDRSVGALLIESAAHYDPTDELADAIDEGERAVVGSDSATRRRLWEYREAATESIASLGTPHKIDVTVPLRRMAEFESALEALVADFDPAAGTFLFGHVADGGIHVNVVSDRQDDLTFDQQVLELVAATGGSISAEHGIGRAKVSALHLSRSPAELSAMRAVKDALDPRGLLNPGVLLPPTRQEPPAP